VEGYIGGELYSVGSASVEVRAGRTSNAAVQMTVVWAGDGSAEPPKPDESGITVVVSPSEVAVETGKSQEFAALVGGTQSQGVKWFVSGSTAPLTAIDPYGLLQVSPAEPVGTVLTVTAVSAVASSRSGTATVTVSDLATLTGAVSVTGDAWANAVLTAAYVSLAGNGTGTETIRWLRNGTEIPGAVGASYTVADGDRGKAITAALQFSGNSGLLESGPLAIQDLTGIYDQDQLAAIRTAAGGLGRNYVLAASFGLSGNWTPVGSSATPFTGSFDGLGNSISGLTINTTAGYQGLFGYVSGGTVKNLGLTGVSIANSGSYTGAVVRLNNGGIIDNCSVTGSVAGSGNYTGGIVGVVNSTGLVYNCSSTASINSSGPYVGGVAGAATNGSTIQNCYSTGNVFSNGAYSSGGYYYSYVGGIVGENYDNCSVINCYATGSVTGNYYYVGGIAGGNSVNSMLKNCYATGNIIGYSSSVGGIVGDNFDNSKVITCYATSNVTGSGDCIGGVVGYNNTNNSTVSYCVALNTIITRASGTTVNIGRVAGNNYVGTLTNNFANNGMSSSPPYLIGSNIGPMNLDGDDVALAVTQVVTWWTTTPGIWGSLWGTSDSTPWQWNGTDYRPKLYFE